MARNSVNDGAHETLAVTGSVNDGADETLAVTEVSCAQSKLPAPHAYHISTITASLLAPEPRSRQGPDSSGRAP